MIQNFQNQFRNDPVQMANQFSYQFCQDLVYSHSYQAVRERTYYLRFLILGAFRSISGLPIYRPDFRVDQIDWESRKLAVLINRVLKFRYGYKDEHFINFFDSNYNFLIDRWNYSCSKDEQDMLDTIPEGISEENHLLAKCLILGCFEHLKHFKTQIGLKDADIIEETSASFDILKNELNKIY